MDIGPTPLGDGVVDAADLKVFMRHWGQEAYDPTLIACWALDEAVGSVATDSAGIHDGPLVVITAGALGYNIYASVRRKPAPVVEPNETGSADVNDVNDMTLE